MSPAAELRLVGIRTEGDEGCAPADLLLRPMKKTLAYNKTDRLSFEKLQ